MNLAGESEPNHANPIRTPKGIREENDDDVDDYDDDNQGSTGRGRWLAIVDSMFQAGKGLIIKWDR